jgi:TIR domain
MTHTLRHDPLVRDVFVSHASEDKESIARPLAEQLRACGLTVWFDEYELELGDSLRRRIDDGLRHSRVGVVILSHSFFAKEWPQRELDGLTARRNAGEPHVIIPVWHDVELDDVISYSPPLGDVLAARSTDGAHSVPQAILRVIDGLDRRADRPKAPTEVSGRTARNGRRGLTDEALRARHSRSGLSASLPLLRLTA